MFSFQQKQKEEKGQDDPFAIDPFSQALIEDLLTKKDKKGVLVTKGIVAFLEKGLFRTVYQSLLSLKTEDLKPAQLQNIFSAAVDYLGSQGSFENLVGFVNFVKDHYPDQLLFTIKQSFKGLVKGKRIAEVYVFLEAAVGLAPSQEATLVNEVAYQFGRRSLQWEILKCLYSIRDKYPNYLRQALSAMADGLGRMTATKGGLNNPSVAYFLKLLMTEHREYLPVAFRSLAYAFGLSEEVLTPFNAKEWRTLRAEQASPTPTFIQYIATEYPDLLPGIIEQAACGLARNESYTQAEIKLAQHFPSWVQSHYPKELPQALKGFLKGYMQEKAYPSVEQLFAKVRWVFPEELAGLFIALEKLLPEGEVPVNVTEDMLTQALIGMQTPEHKIDHARQSAFIRAISSMLEDPESNESDNESGNESEPESKDVLSETSKKQALLIQAKRYKALGDHRKMTFSQLQLYLQPQVFMWLRSCSTAYQGKTGPKLSMDLALLIATYFMPPLPKNTEDRVKVMTQLKTLPFKQDFKAKSPCPLLFFALPASTKEEQEYKDEDTVGLTLQ